MLGFHGDGSRGKDFEVVSLEGLCSISAVPKHNTMTPGGTF